MTPSELNLALAIVIALLSVYIGWTHVRERGWHTPIALLGVAFLAFAVLSIVSAAAPALNVPPEDREVFRFITAFTRGVIIVLLGGYALYRWRR